MKSKIHELQKTNFKIVSKKFMFSAVALVAFSFAGMANTGGEEKLEVEENNNLENLGIDCLDFISLGLETIDPDNNLSQEDLVEAANLFNVMCYFLNTRF